MLQFCFFFFKQKTAYEMRISDWSSDVCSSDLDHQPRKFGVRAGGVRQRRRLRPVADRGNDLGVVVALGVAAVALVAYVLHAEPAQARCVGLQFPVGVVELAVDYPAPLPLRAPLLLRRPTRRPCPPPRPFAPPPAGAAP